MMRPICLLLLLIMAYASSASAFFRFQQERPATKTAPAAARALEEPSASPEPVEPTLTPETMVLPQDDENLVTMGKPERVVESTESCGVGLPLPLAIRLIAPKGWVATVDPASEETPVTWNRNDSWVEAVRSVARQANAQAAVAWSDKRILVRTLSPSESAGPEPETAESAPVTSSELPAWRLDPGLLRPQLESWAHGAGYQIVWNHPQDVEIAAAASFSGTLPDVLAVLIASLRDTGVKIRAQVYDGNHVIVVKED